MWPNNNFFLAFGLYIFHGQFFRFIGKKCLVLLVIAPHDILPFFLNITRDQEKYFLDFHHLLLCFFFFFS